LHDPTILEVGGKPVAVLLPYEQFLKLQDRQRKEAETPELPILRHFCILGRDVLNQLEIQLDGPALTTEILAFQPSLPGT
jgi:hypothetical protein